MQIRRNRRMSRRKYDTIIADSTEVGMMVSSDPHCIGGVYLSVNGAFREVENIFHVRLTPKEIEALWALYQEKGAGTAKT